MTPVKNIRKPITDPSGLKTELEAFPVRKKGAWHENEQDHCPIASILERSGVG